MQMKISKRKTVLLTRFQTILFFMCSSIVISSLEAQAHNNDIDADLPTLKIEFQKALKKGQQDKALEHLKVIKQEYEELSRWDSVSHYSGILAELALELGETEMHVQAFVDQMNIDGLFDEKYPEDWADRIAHINEYKEDPILKHEIKREIYVKLAWYEIKEGARERSIPLINRAIHFSELSGNFDLEIATRREAASLLRANGNHDEALEHLLFIESSENFRTTEPLIQCKTYQIMGDVFRDLGDVEKSKLYYGKLIKLAEGKGYRRILAIGYDHLAELFVSQGFAKEARDNINKGIPIFIEKSMDYQHCNSLINMAESYNLDGDFVLARMYLDSAFIFMQKLNRPVLDFGYYRFEVINNLGLNNIEAAKRSLSVLEKSESEFKNKTSILTKLQYKVAKAAGQDEKALVYFEEHQAIQDSLRQAFSQGRTKRLEAEFNRDEQNEKIQNLAREKTEREKALARRNKALLIGLLVLSIISGLLFVLYRLYRKNKESNLLLSFQNKVMNNTLGENKILLKEIHHRVKNNLQVISSLLSLQERKVDDENTKEALKSSKTRVETMSILHQSLYQNEEYKMISAPQYFDKLINNLINTYDISENLETKVKIADLKFDIEALIPLGLIANELICNSLKHGIGENSKGKLDVALYQEGSSVILSVVDNGGKINKDFLKVNKGSLGVKLIKAFTNRLDATVEVEKSENSTVKIVMDKSTLQFKGAA